MARSRSPPGCPARFAGRPRPTSLATMSVPLSPERPVFHLRPRGADGHVHDPEAEKCRHDHELRRPGKAAGPVPGRCEGHECQAEVRASAKQGAFPGLSLGLGPLNHLKDKEFVRRHRAGFQVTGIRIQKAGRRGPTGPRVRSGRGSRRRPARRADDEQLVVDRGRVGGVAEQVSDADRISQRVPASRTAAPG